MPNETTGERLLARRYRLLARVGHGGMGTVWQAHDEVLGRDVAVKEVILPHGLTDDERAIQYKRTFREARTAARLGHPGVVTVYDVVEEDGRPWIVMELIRARSLDQVIKQDGPLEPRRAAEIARQMLAALHAAHEAGVLHRDVKPSNVLLARGDRAVLTDFGIATAQGDATLTQTGLVMGSPAYIAPERARGRTAGPASDLWALGVTLYTMIGGRSPFERTEPMASLVAVITEEPPPLPAAGRDLATVVDGLLRKDPDQRMDAHEAGPLLDEIVREQTIDSMRTRALPIVPETLPDAPAEQVPAPPEPRRPPRARPPEAQPTVADPAGGSLAAELLGGAGTAPVAEPTARIDAGGPGAGTGPGAGRVLPTLPARTALTKLTELAELPGRLPARTRNLALLIVAAVVATVLAGFGIAALAGGDDGKPARKTGQRAPAASSKQSGGSAPPASSAPARDAVPAGFRLHKDRTGFSVAVPRDWKGPNRRGYAPDSVFFDAPDGRSYIQIDQTSRPNASALRDWERAEAGAKGRFGGYKRIKIAPVRDGQPITDPTGAKAADWEFTFDGGGRKHALNRGLVMNGRGYAIFLVAPDAGWPTTLKDLAPVYRFFKPAP